MQRWTVFVSLWTVFGVVMSYAAPVLQATPTPHGVDIIVDGKLFTAYKAAEDQKYPYFFPVNGPASGASVTTETSEPYPHHHSLFFACDHVNGGNYWQEGIERGQIVSQKVEVAENGPVRVVLRDRCHWQIPGESAIIDDSRTFTITAPDNNTRIIDVHIQLTPLVDVAIVKTNHSLFSARMAPELAVTGGGTLVNAHGATGEQGTFGVESPWCDYYGTRDGVTEGLAILQHPDNRWYPAPWFTRDYGFFSPTPLNWIDEVRLPHGEALNLRYRVIVHAGNTEEAQIAGHFEQYRAES